MKKVVEIFLNAILILVMIGLIPFVRNDYILTVLCIGVILISSLVKRGKGELIIFAAGFILMIVFEYLFVKTGSEIFLRNSLFGVMPVWLPFIWGYGFVAIKRCSEILIA